MISADIRQKPPESLLRREHFARWCVERWRNRDLGREVSTNSWLRDRHGVDKHLEIRRGDIEASEPIPLVAVIDAQRSLEVLDLLGRHHAGVIVFVTRERQTVSLDRVRDDTRR